MRKAGWWTEEEILFQRQRCQLCGHNMCQSPVSLSNLFARHDFVAGNTDVDGPARSRRRLN